MKVATVCRDQKNTLDELNRIVYNVEEKKKGKRERNRMIGCTILPEQYNPVLRHHENEYRA